MGEMIILFLSNMHDIDDPDAVWMAAAFEFLLEAFIVSMVMGLS